MLNESNLHNYQLQGVDHLQKHPRAGLFFGMGLGKTATTLTACNIFLFETLEIDKILIIAPKRVAENVWTEEVYNWTHLAHLRISVIKGTEKQRLAALNASADVYTVGRDNVAWLCGRYGGQKLPFDMLVIDESSSFKNPNSLRFKALRRVMPYFKRVVILTGTPAPNSLIDLWSQIYLLDRGERLFNGITKYRETYFKPNQRKGDIIYNYKLKDGAEAEIHAKISDICISMKAEDYLELPEFVTQDVTVRFDDKLQKEYDKFEEDQIISLLNEIGENQDITALNAAALSNKLLQFANGAIYDENKDFHELHNLKLEACKELIEAANGEPVLIAWTYRHDMIRLKKYLKGYKVRELNTGQDIKDWNNKEIDVLLMHPASGGHGLNLQKGGSIVIWFGQTWSLELYQQLNKRLDRQGQTKPGIIYHLVARNTMDEEVIKRRAVKDETQESLLQAVKARMLKYVKNITNIC